MLKIKNSCLKAIIVTSNQRLRIQGFRKFKEFFYFFSMMFFLINMHFCNNMIRTFSRFFVICPQQQVVINIYTVPLVNFLTIWIRQILRDLNWTHNPWKNTAHAKRANLMPGELFLSLPLYYSLDKCALKGVRVCKCYDWGYRDKQNLNRGI